MENDGVCLLEREERKREGDGKQKAREREGQRERERVHERIGKESGTGSSIILIQTPLLVHSLQTFPLSIFSAFKLL